MSAPSRDREVEHAADDLRQEAVGTIVLQYLLVAAVLTFEQQVALVSVAFLMVAVG